MSILLGRGVRALLTALCSAAVLCGCESVPSLSSLQGRSQVDVPGLEGLYEITDRTSITQLAGEYLAIRREPGKQPDQPPVFAVIAFKKSTPLTEVDVRAERSYRWRASVHNIGGSFVVEGVNMLTPFREMTAESEVAPVAVLPASYFARLDRSGTTITLRELGDIKSPWIAHALATVPGFQVLGVNGNQFLHGDPEVLEQVLTIAFESTADSKPDKVLLEARRIGPLAQALKRQSPPTQAAAATTPSPQPLAAPRTATVSPAPRQPTPTAAPTTLVSATVQIGNILTPYIRAVTVPADGTLTLSVLSINHESIDIDLIPENQLEAWKRVEPHKYFTDFRGERVLRQTLTGRLRGGTKAYLVGRTQIQQENTATVDLNLSFTPDQ